MIATHMMASQTQCAATVLQAVIGLYRLHSSPSLPLPESQKQGEAMLWARVVQIFKRARRACRYQRTRSNQEFFHQMLSPPPRTHQVFFLRSCVVMTRGTSLDQKRPPYPKTACMRCANKCGCGCARLDTASCLQALSKESQSQLLISISLFQSFAERATLSSFLGVPTSPSAKVRGEAPSDAGQLASSLLSQPCAA